MPGLPEWQGDDPYFLMVRRYFTVEMPDAPPQKRFTTTIIDLNEHQWATKHADLMRTPGSWMLCSKELSAKRDKPIPVLIIQVEEGEQPFYARRHIGIMSFGSDEGPKSVSHGIGVKTREGVEEGVFILPNGSITTSGDVYWIADKMNKGQL